MSLQDLFSMAKKNLLSRKLRTFLTLLGVMIGTTAIIVMMSFGFGIKEENEKLIKSMGDITTFEVYPNMEEGKKPQKITDSTIVEFEKIPHVVSVSPVYQDNFSIQYKKFENTSLQVTALDPKAIEAYNWDFEKGKIFKDKGDIEMIFGSKVAGNFYNPKKPQEPILDEKGNYQDPPPAFEAAGTTMEIFKDSSGEMGGLGPFGPQVKPDKGSENKKENKKSSIRVSGVLKERKDFTVDYNAYMSINSYKSLLKDLGLPLPPKNDYTSIKLKVDDIKNARDVEQELKNQGYMVQGLFSMLDSMEKSMGVISAIFGGIGAISFIVAAIGITNTMIMSIYERTREIGVMKVIGASIQDIRRLFLVEAGLIGLLGGIVGVIFSYMLSTLFNNLSTHFAMQNGAEEAVNISIIPIWMVFIAIIFSTLVGVMAGFFPAKRAMNLSALEAIRTE